MTVYANKLSIKRVSEILQGSSVRTAFNRKQQCLCSLLGQERTEDSSQLCPGSKTTALQALAPHVLQFHPNCLPWSSLLRSIRVSFEVLML